MNDEGLHQLGTLDWAPWERKGDKVTLTLTVNDVRLLLRVLEDNAERREEVIPLAGHRRPYRTYVRDPPDGLDAIRLEDIRDRLTKVNKCPGTMMDTPMPGCLDDEGRSPLNKEGE